VLAALVIRTRPQLAEFWLPWCVDADNPERTTHDHEAPAQHPRAAQLRLTDLDTPVIRRALAEQPVDGDRSWTKIAQITRLYRDRASTDATIIVDGTPSAASYDQPTFMTYGNVRMLCEGCHRASALWLSGIEDFELRLVEWPSLWPGYESDEIRRRGRPFRSDGGGID
jgi:hypothetical protein